MTNRQEARIEIRAELVAMENEAVEEYAEQVREERAWFFSEEDEVDSSFLLSAEDDDDIWGNEPDDYGLEPNDDYREDDYYFIGLDD